MRTVGWLVCLALAGCQGRETVPLPVGHVAGGDPAAIPAVAAAVLTAEAPLAGRRLTAVHAGPARTPAEVGGESTRLTALNRVAVVVGGETAAEAERLRPAEGADPVLAFTAAGSLGPAPVAPGAPALPLVFPLGLAPGERGRMLARHCRDALRPASVHVLVDERSHSATAHAAAFARELAGGPLSPEVTRVRSDADLVAAAERVRGRRPAALAVALSPAGARALLANWPGTRPTLILLGEDADWEAVRGDPGLSGEAWLACLTLPPLGADGATDAGRAWLKAARERGAAEPTVPTRLHAEGVRLWADAVRATQSITTAKLREHLLKAEKHETVHGPIRFTPRHEVRRPGTIVRSTGGRTEALVTVEPAGE